LRRGLLLCLVPMMTLLPVLLLRGHQNVMDRQIHEDETRARIENIWLQRPVLVTGIVVALCAVAAFEARKVLFRLQPDGIAKPQPVIGRV